MSESRYFLVRDGAETEVTFKQAQEIFYSGINSRMNELVKSYVSLIKENEVQNDLQA